jgi:hypothetical protein
MHGTGGGVDDLLGQRALADRLLPSTEKRRRVDVEFKRISVSALSSITSASSTLVQSSFSLSSICTATTLVMLAGWYGGLALVGCRLLSVLLDCSGNDFTVFPSGVFDLVIFIRFLVFFVQATEETTLTGTCGTVSAITFLSHTVDSSRDIEGFLENANTGGSAFSVRGSNRCE